MAQKRTRPSTGTYSDGDPIRSSVIGYVHNVSPVKISRNNSSYFNAKFQMENDVFPVVCFSPQKRNGFLNAETLKSPVKLTNVRLTPGKSTTDIQAYHSSTLISLAEPLCFTRKLSVVDTIKEAISIKIKDVKLEDVNESNRYNIKGKVIKIEDEKQALIHGTKKRFQDITIYDSEDNITIILYEHLLGKVELEKNYNFTNVKLSVFNQIKLTTTKDTMIEMIEKNFTVPEGFVVSNSEFISGRVISARINIKTNCPSCQKHVANVDTNQGTIYCNLCNTRVRKSALVGQSIATLQIESNDVKVTLFNDLLTKYFKDKDLKHLVLNKTGLEDYFLQDNIIFELEFDQNKTVIKIEGKPLV